MNRYALICAVIACLFSALMIYDDVVGNFRWFWDDVIIAMAFAMATWALDEDDSKSDFDS